MKWGRIIKRRSAYPNHPHYSLFKKILAKEGGNRCVYCSVSESAWGGYRNFHVEHYKPKSRFQSLEHDPFNLFYACSVCNSFKGDDWPQNPAKDHSVVAYPRPSVVDYANLFQVTNATGRISGRNRAANYIIEKLFLNRPFLQTQRRLHLIDEKLAEVFKYIEAIVDELSKLAETEPTIIPLLTDLLKSSTQLGAARQSVARSIPYQPADIQRDE